jgi:hypothetical protein
VFFDRIGSKGIRNHTKYKFKENKTFNTPRYAVASVFGLALVVSSNYMPDSGNISERLVAA